MSEEKIKQLQRLLKEAAAKETELRGTIERQKIVHSHLAGKFSSLAAWARAKVQREAAESSEATKRDPVPLAERIIREWDDVSNGAEADSQRYQDDGVYLGQMIGWLVGLIDDWSEQSTSTPERDAPVYCAGCGAKMDRCSFCDDCQGKMDADAEDDLDFTKCPGCGGPTEFDRSVPPSPYLCDDCVKRQFELSPTELSQLDSEIVAKMLENPGEPNEALQSAVNANLDVLGDPQDSTKEPRQ